MCNFCIAFANNKLTIILNFSQDVVEKLVMNHAIANRV